jgi:hypothetical protein
VLLANLQVLPTSAKATASNKGLRWHALAFVASWKLIVYIALIDAHTFAHGEGCARDREAPSCRSESVLPVTSGTVAVAEPPERSSSLELKAVKHYLVVICLACTGAFVARIFNPVSHQINNSKGRQQSTKACTVATKQHEASKAICRL